MLKLDIRLDIRRLKSEFKGHEDEVNKGAGRAMDRALITGRKEASKLIRSNLNLKSTVVKEVINIERPFGRNVLIRALVASGSPIPLREFGANETKKGVSFAVKRGNRHIYERQGIKGFIHKNAGRHVFVRLTANPPGPSRARIKKVFGPSIPQYFLTQSVRVPVIRTIQLRWPVEFDREMSFRRSKLGL